MHVVIAAAVAAVAGGVAGFAFRGKIAKAKAAAEAKVAAAAADVAKKV